MDQTVLSFMIFFAGLFMIFFADFVLDVLIVVYIIKVYLIEVKVKLTFI